MDETGNTSSDSKTNIDPIETEVEQSVDTKTIQNVEPVPEPTRETIEATEVSANGSVEKSNIDADRLSSHQEETTIVQEQLKTHAVEPPNVSNKKKDDEKTGIYKALAIKLKKELVRTRDELHKLQNDTQKEKESLTGQLRNIEDTLSSERIGHNTTRATLEATVRNLKSQLEATYDDLKSMQIEFENYKVRASQIMQKQNTSVQLNSFKTFEEERYKQLKTLNEEQRLRISNLEEQTEKLLSQNCELENNRKLLQEKLQLAQTETKNYKELENKFTNLVKENENLKCALKQYGAKLKEPNSAQPDTSNKAYPDDRQEESKVTTPKRGYVHCSPILADVPTELAPTNKVSPSGSVKDDCHTNSSSSFDGSTSGYVHIKPTTFEIISRSSLLEDAQNQIDNLTKAYLDSESTNSLLSEQVRALKEEIRRIQRGTERMDLAENLEYLKNVVFKFISLDSSHLEQRQRLIPVLSTVLKLSPDETAKLSSMAAPQPTSMAGSLFKFSGVGGG